MIFEELLSSRAPCMEIIPSPFANKQFVIPFVNMQRVQLMGSQHKKRNHAIWTREEDKKLVEAINIYGTNNWSMVSNIVITKSRSQCAQRWNRTLNPDIKYSNWSQIEDQSLINAIQKYGTSAWVLVARHVGHRSDLQCRRRFQALKKIYHFDESFFPPSSKEEIKVVLPPISSLKIDEKVFPSFAAFVM